MQRDLITVIIVNYNGKKWLNECLGSLFQQNYAELEIILVDNNSSDDSVEFVQKNFPKIKIIKSDKI